MLRPLFNPRKDSVPIVQEAGWAPEPVWTGAENLSPTRIRSTDRPARSQSLYRLHYPAHRWYRVVVGNIYQKHTTTLPKHLKPTASEFTNLDCMPVLTTEVSYDFCSVPSGKP